MVRHVVLPLAIDPYVATGVSMSVFISFSSARAHPPTIQILTAIVVSILSQASKPQVLVLTDGVGSHDHGN